MPIFIAVIGFLAALSCRAAEASPAADTVFSGGAIFTATVNGATVDAVAVRDGRIVYAGDVGGLAPYLGTGTTRVAIGDGLLLPGFIDAHSHPIGVGLGLTAHCDVSGIGARERILARIAACARERAGEPWLVGRGWALGAFEHSRPSAADLDAVLPEGMAAYLTAEDGHNGWASSLALARAGVTAATPDPPGGQVERNADGSPQGTLRERAMGLVRPVLPPLTARQQLEALHAALARFNGYGITSLVDAGASAPTLALYRELRRRRELTARSVMALWVGPDWDGDIDAVAALHDADDPMLRVTQIKLMLDGVMENQTAHLSFAYPGLGHSGTAFFSDEDRLAGWVSDFESLGYQMHFHTVGDAAITQGLRVLAHSREARGAPNIRPVFAHDYLVREDDYEPLREAGAFLQLTMLWDQQNDSMVNLNRPYLDGEQYAALMPAERLLEAGLPVIGGSDAPVGQANPLASIQVAVTGQGVPYFDGGDMAPQPPMPGGRVALDDMLVAYTRRAAEALAIDDLVGTIEVGKRADLVLLARNPRAVPAAEIYGIPVAMTLLDGRVVYRAATE